MSVGSAGLGSDKRRFVNIAAAITATGGLLFGYDTGVISGALLFIRQDFAPLSPFVEGIIVSTLLVGAVVGALSGGPLSDRVGRRPTALLAALIFGAGALAVAFAPSVAFIIFGRFLLGLGVGLASMIVPLYIAEIAPAARRGALVSDRKSTRLNSSHANISYAVFCLKKNKTQLLNRPSPLHFPTPQPASSSRPALLPPLSPPPPPPLLSLPPVPHPLFCFLPL